MSEGQAAAFSLLLREPPTHVCSNDVKHSTITPKRCNRFSHHSNAGVLPPIRVGVRMWKKLLLYLICSREYCFPLFVSCNVLIISLLKLAFLTNVITSGNCYKRLLLKKSNVSLCRVGIITSLNVCPMLGKPGLEEVLQTQSSIPCFTLFLFSISRVILAQSNSESIVSWDLPNDHTT